jgi:hypothetical protein
MDTECIPLERSKLSGVDSRETARATVNDVRPSELALIGHAYTLTIDKKPWRLCRGAHGEKSR